MLFMVIERFKDRNPAPIYDRLREAGRSLPDGVHDIDSWVEANFDRCFHTSSLWGGRAVRLRRTRTGSLPAVRSAIRMTDWSALRATAQDSPVSC